MNNEIPLRKMQFKNFLVELNNPKENRVLYLQKQNDSFTSEFSKLMDDIDASPSWSAKIFGLYKNKPAYYVLSLLILYSR